MGVSLLHNMLVRELAVVALLVIVLISFYIRYTAAAHKEYVRTRERRMALVVHSARRQLVVVVILLAAVLVYDRVLPHFGIGASAARQATVSKHHAPAKIKVVSSSKKSSSSSHKPSKQADSARIASSKQAASASMIAASKSASASRAASASATSASQAASASASSASASSAEAASSSAASSSKAATSGNPKQKAVSAMQQYLAQHPNAVAGRVDNVGVIDYSTDYNGVPAYQVGLYQTQADGSSVAIHMYFVYASGNVVQAY